MTRNNFIEGLLYEGLLFLPYYKNIYKNIHYIIIIIIYSYVYILIYLYYYIIILYLLL